ncbi:hypothetical protein MY11210_007907 [Beauveria gryllotalpidicola]
MSSLHNTVIVIALLCIALCSAAILYTTFQIIRILRCTSHQFLVFAAELLDLLDPLPPPSSSLNATPSVRSSSLASHSELDDLVAGHAGWDAPLSPVVLADSPPPLPDIKVLPLDEELCTASTSPSQQEREDLGLGVCWREESPSGRRLGYPAAREGRPHAGCRSRRPGLRLQPLMSSARLSQE